MSQEMTQQRVRTKFVFEFWLDMKQEAEAKGKELGWSHP